MEGYLVYFKELDSKYIHFYRNKRDLNTHIKDHKNLIKDIQKLMIKEDKIIIEKIKDLTSLLG